MFPVLGSEVELTFSDQGEFTPLISLLQANAYCEIDSYRIVKIMSGAVISRYMGWVVDGANYFGDIIVDIFDYACDEMMEYLDHLDSAGNIRSQLLIEEGELYDSAMRCLTNFYHRLRDLAGNTGLFSQYLWTVEQTGDFNQGNPGFRFKVRLHSNKTPITGSIVDEWFQSGF